MNIEIMISGRKRKQERNVRTRHNGAITIQNDQREKTSELYQEEESEEHSKDMSSMSIFWYYSQEVEQLLISLLIGLKKDEQ